MYYGLRLSRYGEAPIGSSVRQLYLDIVAESVLVIRNDELVTRDARLADADTVEIRPVISGGC